MDFDVVVVTYRSGQHITTCLQSLRLAEPAPQSVTIVDNASDDDTCERIRAVDWPAVRIVRNATNRGFSVACNQGAAFGSATGLFFCNPDVLVPRNVLSALDSILERMDVGCVSPANVDASGRERGFAFDLPRPPWLVPVAALRILLGQRRRGAIHVNRRSSDVFISCDWVIGATLAIRRNIFARVAGFDERFFLYFEDIDESARDRDELVVVLPDTPLDAARTLAERIRKACHSIVINDQRVSVSIGLSARPPNSDVDVALAEADSALYKAKRTGRNRVWCSG